MIRCYPLLRQELMDSSGRLYQHVHIFVNSRDAHFLDQGLDTPLSLQDTLGIFPAVGGGQVV
jgi:molybdopterin converting factor small subunit